MHRKLTPRADNVWRNLRSLILPIEDSKVYNLLNTVKQWIEENKRILGGLDFAKARPALSLLLEGKASQFPINRPIEAGQYLKRQVLTLPIPKHVEEMADRLETVIREFAVFTEWQDCPICQEGYLGYWIEPCTKRLVLSCPECWWQQDINGQEWVDSLPLLPASIQELGMQKTSIDN